MPLWRLAPDAIELMRDPKMQAAGVIKKLEGGDRLIIDPLATLVANTHAMVRSALESRMWAETVDAIEAGAPEFGRRVTPQQRVINLKLDEIRGALGPAAAEADLDAVATIFRPVTDEVKGEVVVWRDGEKQHWRLDPLLYRVGKSLRPDMMAPWLKFFGIPKRLFKAGIVYSLDFMTTNTVRDATVSAIQGRGSKIPMKNFADGLVEMLAAKRGKSDIIAKWGAGAGRMFSLAAADSAEMRRRLGDGGIDALRRTIKDLGLAFADPRKPAEIAAALGRAASELMGAAEATGEWFEAPTRIGVFKRALANPLAEDVTGYDRLLRAGHESRDASTDFLRSWYGMADLNHLVAFLNPALQGADKMRRFVMANPGNAATVAASMAFVEWALYQHNKDKESYDAVPAWLRDISWVIALDDTAIIIPGPFEYKMVFGGVPRRVYEWLDGTEPDLSASIGETLGRAAKFNMLPTAAVPLVENFGNWSMFKNRPIVPRSMADVEPGQQATAATSALSRRSHMPRCRPAFIGSGTSSTRSPTRTTAERSRRRSTAGSTD